MERQRILQRKMSQASMQRCAPLDLRCAAYANGVAKEFFCGSLATSGQTLIGA